MRQVACAVTPADRSFHEQGVQSLPSGRRDGDIADNNCADHTCDRRNDPSTKPARIPVAR